MTHIPKLPVLALALVPGLAVLLAVALARAVGGVPMHYLTRDIASLAGVHPFFGVMSNLGLMLWAAAAAVSLLTVLIRMKSGEGNTKFFLASGALSLWLLFDDAFLFHEELAPTHLGLMTEIVLAGLGVAVITWLGVFRREILAAGPFFLVLALGMFALSLGVDFAADIFPAAETETSWRIFYEDAPKWLGIVFWLAFHVTASVNTLTGRAPAQSR
jgi:hypothetical protein